MDNTVRLWDLKNAPAHQLTSLYDPYGERADGEVLSVAVSPDAKQIATGRIDGAIKLWDVAKLLSGGPTALYPYNPCLTPVAAVLRDPPATPGSNKPSPPATSKTP